MTRNVACSRCVTYKDNPGRNITTIALDTRGRYSSDKSSGLRRTDSQAAVRSTARPKGMSVDYLPREVIRRVEQLQTQGCTAEIRWIPAHSGIHGKEEADRAAKGATGSRSHGRTELRVEPPPGLHPLHDPEDARA
ncbi:Uncharacterized protein TPAR_07292 [Tolypocladium paradoxum]|uniref:Uncharacterized protein n=1 Tax=Tolypocladium paradoxum TaxID=94208 RepID=A0A2S4KQR2_9HYPO|nr:Uncharacterized protein TPAR_07292 [Tolypocladium paradoxum]